VGEIVDRKGHLVAVGGRDPGIGRGNAGFCDQRAKRLHRARGEQVRGCCGGRPNVRHARQVGGNRLHGRCGRSGCFGDLGEPGAGSSHKQQVGTDCSAACQFEREGPPKPARRAGSSSPTRRHDRRPSPTSRTCHDQRRRSLGAHQRPERYVELVQTAPEHGSARPGSAAAGLIAAGAPTAASPSTTRGSTANVPSVTPARQSLPRVNSRVRLGRRVGGRSQTLGRRGRRLFGPALEPRRGFD
jgi:hypothetical protein